MKLKKNSSLNNWVFLIDPLESINPKKDTSFIIMYEAYQKGKNIFFLDKNKISYQEGKFSFTVQKLIPQKNLLLPFITEETRTLFDNEVSVIFLRLEPPFDNQYLEITYLLEKLENKIPVLNSPKAIRSINEKIWISSYVDITPKTLITSEKQKYLQFLSQHKEIILKPTNSFGGQGIFKTSIDDSNKKVIFEQLSKNETQFVIVQEFLLNSNKGDKRVLLLEGEVLGTILRLNKDKSEHRNNFFSGGNAYQTTLTPQEKKIIKTISPLIKKFDLFFVGIDIIDEKLIEVNVTCPTCLQEMNHIYKKNLTKKIIHATEQKILQIKT